jgi:hypothetical protein
MIFSIQTASKAAEAIKNTKIQRNVQCVVAWWQCKTTFLGPKSAVSLSGETRDKMIGR